MSLILQALKKAEAERELGRVPTLTSAEPAAIDPPGTRRPTAVWAAAAFALLLGLSLAGWWWWPRPAPAPVEVAAAPAPAPVPAPAPRPMPATMPAPPVSAAPSPPSPQPVRAPPQSPRPAASAPLPTQDQLPPELQRLLPNLAVTGTIWSKSPADRMLMIAGQVLHEGDRLTPEIELQSIGPREAVLRVRGTAFRLPY